MNCTEAPGARGGPRVQESTPPARPAPGLPERKLAFQGSWSATETLAADREPVLVKESW